MFHSMQSMPYGFKQFHNSRSPQQRSVSLPRSVSYSAHASLCLNAIFLSSFFSFSRHGKARIISAIGVLLDELDADGLRDVVDEAQHRIKKLR
uniref:Uncharacterized protein n=1 Tax=Elaeophora elaphi TaxID=1147741 RepID=A0A0R3RGR9_9BILA